MTEKKTRKPRKAKVVTTVAINQTQELQKTDSVAVEGFISQALSTNVPVETLERLFALRVQVKKEAAQEAYISAMAKFQAECPVITKTKEVVVNGSVVYSYAPIDSIVTQVKHAIENNGFSYSTNMKMLEDGVTVTVKVQHILGHSEDTEMSVPLGTKTGVMSRSQQVAAASTFAKRYAFLNAFGILTGDEDNDGANLGTDTKSAASTFAKPLALDNPVVIDYKKKLESSKNIVELSNVWANMPRSVKDVLESTKDEMKAILNTENHENN